MRHGQNERGLATGRKAWLFVGSDDHGSATGNLLSLVASCRLHGLDPETYLAEALRADAEAAAHRDAAEEGRDRLGVVREHDVQRVLGLEVAQERTAVADPKTFGKEVGYVPVPDPPPAKEQASA